MNRFLIALICSIVLTSCQQRPEKNASNASSAANQLSGYSATTLAGQPFNLDQTRGRVLLLNVWATWCGPCRHEVPELKALQQKYSRKKFDVVGISVDTEDATGAVREFVAEEKINYPIVLDPAGRIMTALDTVVLPTSVLLDRTGKVVWKQIGIVEADDKELIKALQAAL